MRVLNALPARHPAHEVISHWKCLQKHHLRAACELQVADPLRKTLAKALSRALKSGKASAAERKKWQTHLKQYGLENEIK